MLPGDVFQDGPDAAAGGIPSCWLRWAGNGSPFRLTADDGGVPGVTPMAQLMPKEKDASLLASTDQGFDEHLRTTSAWRRCCWASIVGR